MATCAVRHVNGTVSLYRWDGLDVTTIEKSLTNITYVMCGGPCVAIKTDRTVISWNYGTLYSKEDVDVANVSFAMCGGYACVAILFNRSAITWGNIGYGGDSSTVDLTNIRSASCGGAACVAVKSNGIAFTWGGALAGGDSSTIDLSSVEAAMCGDHACAALMKNGTGISWGNRFHGGDSSGVDLTNLAMPCKISNFIHVKFQILLVKGQIHG